MKMNYLANSHSVIPAKAGIQLIKKFPRSGSILDILSASRSFVFAGFPLSRE